MTTKDRTMYDTITQKLGFPPEQFEPEYPGHECDNITSPLKKLEPNELRFLVKNNFFVTEK